MDSHGEDVRGSLGAGRRGDRTAPARGTGKLPCRWAACSFFTFLPHSRRSPPPWRGEVCEHSFPSLRPVESFLDIQLSLLNMSAITSDLKKNLFWNSNYGFTGHCKDWSRVPLIHAPLLLVSCVAIEPGNDVSHMSLNTGTHLCTAGLRLYNFVT